MCVKRWVRVATAVSALWIAASTIALMCIDLRIARLLRYAAFEACDYINHYLCRCANCWHDVMAMATFADHTWANFALIAFAPIVLLWVCAAAVLGVGRVITASSG
jgi:hypothetical protein